MAVEGVGVAVGVGEADMVGVGVGVIVVEGDADGEAVGVTVGVGEADAVGVGVGVGALLATVTYTASLPSCASLLEKARAVIEWGPNGTPDRSQVNVFGGDDAK
jgi:hypothetical protein